ncbi:MAG: AmmeMemoRadiSam system radical SAM enzyme [Bacteroidales bacterium]|jgi:pyruvate formate lyase activating enzyme|nr:AmmeMemoRadiSam system radical SAM enzyme [Bacteroidales bacterium]
MTEAFYYTKKENQKVQCALCPHQCVIMPGKSGICKVRKNENGRLIASSYGLISSMGFDPIEKKPLYHFYPGAEILSVGSIGCNLTCDFCQNWQISQTSAEDFGQEGKLFFPEQIAQIAQSEANNLGVAYTYNEPTVFYEFMLRTAEKVKENNQKNVMVTNGFIKTKPLDQLHRVIDAYSVDLKAFHNDFFVKYTRSQLEPVKQTIRNIAAAGKHLEITNLVIPSLNDHPEEFEQMVKWIAQNTGKETVLHISRYYPTYKLSIEGTPVSKLRELKQIADHYLSYVYMGNIQMPEGNNTCCWKCGEPVINREGYRVKKRSLTPEGACKKCGNPILKFYNE